MSAITTFPPPIRDFLGDFAAASRRAALVRAGLLALATFISWTLLSCLADRLLALPSGLRAGLLAVGVGAVLAILFSPLRDLFLPRPDWIGASRQIEGKDPSLGERLITVTSQLLTPPRYRGSDQMLGVLVDEVSTQVVHANPRRLVGWTSARRPALLVVIALGLVSVLLPLRWLNLPHLVLRHFQPFADIPAVTLTQIEINPGSTDVRQRDSVTIKATIRNLRGPGPALHLTTDGREYTRTAMDPTADGTWSLTLPSLESDVSYFVKAGDARTRTYSVRVRRRPAVAQFNIRYVYPAYTGRQPLTVQNHDGLIEAPQGSEATVSIVATEKVSSALLRTSDGRRLEAWATDQPHVRQVKLEIIKDATYELELISDRGVEGRVPGKMQIRAVPDRPPLVRLIQPAGDLRLAPRDLVPITFQALDDYGVERVWVELQINGGPRAELPLQIDLADPRRIAGTADLDLAKLDAKVGDVVTLTLRAVDKATHKSATEPRHILVSPRSVDVATHQRITELRLAADYAKEFAEQFTRAHEYLERAAKEGPPALGQWDTNSPWNKAARQLASAQEAGALLRQSLLRAIVHSGNPSMSDCLAQQIDSVVAQFDTAGRADQALLSSATAIDADLVARTARAASNARDLATQVKQLLEGDQAAAAIADRANLKASEVNIAAANAAADRRKQTLARAKQEINASLALLGINAKDNDPAIDAQLRQRVQTAQQLIQSTRPVDFVAMSTRWATSLKQEVNRRQDATPSANDPRPRRGASRMEERLYAASHAEALRADADLVAARDLQIAARAAASLTRKLEAAVLQGEQTSRAEVADALEKYPKAIAALRAGHEVNRRAHRAQTVEQAKSIHAAAADVHNEAAAARALLTSWIGDSAARIASRADAEDLAMAANAYTASKEFDKAAAADRQLAAQLNKPDLARAADAPRAIHAASTTQETLAAQAARAPNDAQAASIAAAQRQIADALPKPEPRIADSWSTSTGATDTVDSRQQATQAITAAQEKLAALPMQMLNAQQLAASLAETSKRLAAAQAEAANATPAGKDMADRAAKQIADELSELQQAFGEAAAPLAGKLAEDLADSLRPFAPETTGPVSTLDDELKPALSELHQALRQLSQGGDATNLNIETTAQSARDAIQQTQDALRQAQSQVMERDPLVAAKWFARQAADALSATKGNRRAAAAHQQRTLDALNKAAWDALRRSKNARLSQLPTIGQLYLPPVPRDWPSDSPETQERQRLINALPGLREWGRLRDQLSDSYAYPYTAPTREADPPAYSESLRIYFEVLNKEENKTTREDRPNR